MGAHTTVTSFRMASREIPAPSGHPELPAGAANARQEEGDRAARWRRRTRAASFDHLVGGGEHA